jgi:MSHA pilin protein MshA
MNKSQSGFTLVELIVVIVILGILAATALPRFINLTGDAKASSMQGLAGSLRSAVQLVQGKWMVGGSTGQSTVLLADGTTSVPVSTGASGGIPTAAGIVTAIGSPTGYANTGSSPVSFTPTGGPAACIVTYDPATGTVVDTAATAANCGGA